jgi:hypothetical protein
MERHPPEGIGCGTVIIILFLRVFGSFILQVIAFFILLILLTLCSAR